MLCMSSVRPTRQNDHLSTSPQEALIRRRRWVCWRYDRRGKKRPVDPRTGKAASTADPQTWGCFEAAAAAAEEHGHDGIGFVLTAEDPYAVIDLDGVVDPFSGQVQPWAAELVDRFDSYAELSRLTDIAESTLSGALHPRRATVAVQAYNALIRALEQERKIVEQEEIMDRLERLEARRGMAS
jgi:hypothetical protein